VNKLPKRAVPAILKAASLLDALAVSEEPLTLGALSAKLRLPGSTVHTLCATLSYVGLIRRFENATYHLGMHIMDLSAAFLARTDATVEFARVSDSLDLLPSETVILSVLDGADVVYVGCRNRRSSLGLSFSIGMRLPANCTSTGKALLSTLPEAQLAALHSTGRFRSLTKNSVTDLPTLLKQFAQVRRRGYSVDDEETCHGMMCYGAPVFDGTNKQAVAAVGVSCMKATLNSRKKATVIQGLRQFSVTLSQRLGARGLSFLGLLSKTK
jgi:DNA-binding IclR family transcriptional regulator